MEAAAMPAMALYTVPPTGLSTGSPFHCLRERMDRMGSPSIHNGLIDSTSLHGLEPRDNTEMAEEFSSRRMAARAGGRSSTRIATFTMLPLIRGTATFS